MEEEKLKKQEEKDKKQLELKEKLSEQVDKQMESLLSKGVNSENITYLSKLVDICKDSENITYWKEKIKMYREGNYGEYNDYNEGYGRRGVPGSGRGRYREGYSEGSYNEGSYGRRGVRGTGRGRYRGEDMMEEMNFHYGEYSEGRDSYGADPETMKSLEKMLESVKKFMKHLEQEASSQEEVQMIKKTAKEISMM